jgi:phenylpropionate dioxygenase-like ring-hydroxylating dioxygenase large terminal subunit
MAIAKFAKRENETDLRKVGIHPDHWYPIAWTHELKRGQPIARSFAGEPIVLFRTKMGRLIALEDRCAHRQVPLHLGKIDGETLRCGYHGWAYDGTGRCVDVPYLGRARICNAVRSYPVGEADGMVFVFPGDARVAASRALPSPGSRADGRYVTRRLYRDVACHYSFMHENLFDMNHQFLHRRQMGLIRTRCLGRRSGEDWCEVDYTFTRAAGRASWGETAIIRTGKNSEPDADKMTIRTEYPYQRLKFWIDAGDPVLDVWISYVPLDAEQKTNRTFGHLSVKKPALSFLLYAAWPFITWFTERIFKEDKDIVEQEQAAHDAQGSDWNNEVFEPILDLRRLLVRCGAA